MDKKLIEDIVTQITADSQYYLVEICIKPGNSIVVEIDSDNAVDLDYCVSLSKQIEANLPDRDTEDYELEVGSAGISSPLKILRQYTKHIGKEVEILSKKGIKRAGILKSANNSQVILEVERQIKPEGAKRKMTIKEDLIFPFDEIKYTKAVIKI